MRLNIRALRYSATIRDVREQIRPARRLGMRRRGRSVPAGTSPGTIRECTTVPEAAPRRRQPQATAAATVPDSRRLSGCPVWPGWLPTHRPKAAQDGLSVPLAPRRHQNGMPSSPCRDYTPAPFSAPSIPGFRVLPRVRRSSFASFRSASDPVVTGRVPAASLHDAQNGLTGRCYRSPTPYSASKE